MLSVFVHKVVGGVADVLLKTTLPAGLVTPPKAGATVAVKVTDWLTAEGLGKDATVVLVEATVTASDRTLETALLKFEFDEVKEAVTVWVPSEGNAYVQAGTLPVEVSVTVQSVVLVSVSV